MPSDIALNVATTYTDTGLKKASSDVKQLGDNVNKAGSQIENTSSKNEGLLKRLERPLGRTLYSGLAEQLFSADAATGKMTGATIGLERGFHAAGMAATFLGGSFASVILLGASLVSLFLKIAEATNISKESVEKETKTHRDKIELIKASIPILQKNGLLTSEEAKRLQTVKSLEEDSIKQLEKKIDLQIKQAKTNLALQQSRMKDASIYHDEAQVKFQIAQAEQKLNDLIQVKLGLSSEASVADKNEAKNIDDVWKKKILLIQAQSKELEQKQLMLDYSKTDKSRVEEIIKLEDENVRLAEKLMTVKTEAEKADLQRHIEYNNALIDSDRKYLQFKKQTDEKLKSEVETLGKALVDESGKFMSDLVKGNLEGLKEDVANFAWANSEKLFVQAVADSFDPLRAALAPGEFAASAGLAALGAGLGSSKSSGPESSAGGQGSAQNSLSPGSSTGTQEKNSNLTIIVQGGIMDDQFAANLAKRLSDVVAMNNVTLKASQVIA